MSSQGKVYTEHALSEWGRSRTRGSAGWRATANGGLFQPRHGGRFFTLILCVLALSGCGLIIPQPTDDYVDGRLRISYWEKWGGAYGKIIRSVVDQFNASQDRLYVDILIVSQINQKALLAIAAGKPPDLVGLWSGDIPQYAEQGALMCLDPFMERGTLRREDFIDIFITVNSYDGKVYALPTTPSTNALHWNKDLFEEAGLDPEVPPGTLDELDEMAARLTKYDDRGNLIRLGFSPFEPPWWPWEWGYWFGGRLWDGSSQITLNSPENVRAYEWVQGHTKRYGTNQLQTFQSGFGNYLSAQSAFLSGKVAMVLDGVWMHNVIARYSPGLRCGAAPFPSAVPGLTGVAVAESDSLSIPVGARHPDEAFQFIEFLCGQEGSEMLNMMHGKFTPLKRVSREFIENNPNPNVEMFRDLAQSPDVFCAPRMGIWYEYADEIAPMMDAIRLGKATPEELLPHVQQRVQHKLEQARRRMQRRAAVEGVLKHDTRGET